MERWSIFIDIEGFSALWEHDDQVLRSLGDLMEGIYKIGCRCYPNPPDRIFAHQLGDGFIILSDVSSDSLDVPIAISVALMRHVGAGGRFASSAITTGGFADIASCYPPSIRTAIGDDGRVPMGSGMLTVFPVMGTALIRAYGLGKKAPRGSLLALKVSDKPRIPAGFLLQQPHESDIVLVDWIHSQSALVSHLQAEAGLRAPEARELERAVLGYCDDRNVPTRWRENTITFLSVTKDT
ncbi:MAG: hypothetical protein J0L64_24730 [Acidobacteria bacterium]|nr:hypothetical protein [Acidobacteriota bacterium]